MMKTIKVISLLSVSLMMIMACNNNRGNNKGNQNTISVNPKEMKYIGSISDRYQSYNIEMVEVVGGEFWRPYKSMDSLPSAEAASGYDVSQHNSQMYRKLPPVNLADKRLLTLAEGLAPAYVRVSGTWANAIYFQNNDGPKISKPPAGFANVLTRNEWKGVIDFIKATDSKLVTSFTVSNGVRDAQGVWTPKEAQKIADYTKSLGGSIAAAELFNEPTMPTAGGDMNKNYNVSDFAKDESVFYKWAKKELPDMLIAGPGTVTMGTDSSGKAFEGMGMPFLLTDSIMTVEPKPVYDIFSYHFYGAASMRMMQSGPFSIKATDALDSSWLRRTDTIADYYVRLRNKYYPGKPIWITETAEAAAGGDPFSATYLDCFRYLYQLGSLAQKGVQVIIHNTLDASEYSLVDQDTHLPKPNYWAALLWARFMGTKVYDAGNGTPGVYLFAQSMKGHEGGITLLVLNTNKASTSIKIPSNAEQYTLTAKELQDTTVQLNGQDLRLTSDDMLPAITGKEINAGKIELPSTSITFLTLPDAGNMNGK